MAITVPQAERQVQVGGLPGTPAIPQLNGNAPAEAFGGGPAGAAISQSADKLGSMVDQYTAEAAKHANDSAMTGLDLEASREQTRIELAAKKMQGLDAAKAQDFATAEWTKVQENLKKKASNDTQVEGISKILGARGAGIDRIVMEHASSELDKHDQAQSESYIQAQADEAINNYQDPGRVAQARALQNDEIARMGARHGYSPEMIAQKQHDSGSLTNTAVVSRMLDNGDYKSAQAFYDGNKAGFATKDILVVEKSLEEGKTKAKGMAAWNDLQGLKLSDGTPDEGRMEKSVLAMTDATDSEKEKILTFVKAKAGDARARKAEADRAHDRAFLNGAVQARKNGVGLESALNMAKTFAADPYDQALKEDAIHKIYAPAEVHTDPATKVALLDGIDEGNVTRDQIDKAYQDGKLSPADWTAARERFHNVVAEGKSPAQQRANEQLKIIAKGRFGSDADGMASFMSEVKSDAAGKSPDEMIKIATDKMKADESTATRFWNWIPAVGGSTIPGFSGRPQYETDIEKRGNESLVKGKLQQDLGVETVKAIDVGNIRSGSNASTAQTVEALSVALGGYENINPGKPAYNAMQSLSKAGKVVTVESVKKVLEFYPDGNFTAPSAVASSTRIGKLPRGGR